MCSMVSSVGSESTSRHSARGVRLSRQFTHTIRRSACIAVVRNTATQTLVIRGVFDTERQDRIIGWARSAKSEKHLQRPIVISFQKEIPRSSEPDIMLREVEI